MALCDDMPKLNGEPLMSIADLASCLGLTTQSIRHWLAGVPSEGGAAMRPKRYRLSTLIRQRWLTKADDVDEDGPKLDLDQERARLAAEQADERAMKNAVTRGELAPIEYLDLEISAYTAAVAAAWDAIPSQIRRALPHLNTADHDEIDRVFATERDRLAGRLASGQYDDRPIVGSDSAGAPAAAEAAGE